MLRACVAALVAMSVGVSIASAQGLRTYRVKADASGANTGLSWADALTDLQAALAAAQPGDQIWVAAGIYRPAGPSGNRTASFTLKSGLIVYGGFAGTETRASERDPSANETVLSGDLNGDDASGPGLNAENSYHVVVANSCVDTVLDGFVITAGNASGSSSGRGGGISLSGGSCMIRNCIMRGNNAANYGGGAYCFSGSAITGCLFIANSAAYGAGLYGSGGVHLIADCTFQDNAASNTSGYAAGGGVYIDGASSGACTLSACTFRGNASHNTAGYAYGGAVYAGDCTMNLLDCIFETNSAHSTNYSGFGGAMYTSYTTTSMARCTLRDNTANYDGGGVYVYGHHGGQQSIANSSFQGNGAGHWGGGVYIHYAATQIKNCVVTGNRANYSGGGICSTGAASNILNCTFGGNYATNYGGFYCPSGSPNLNNCILWDNSDYNGASEAAQIGGGAAAVSYSCVQGWSGAFEGTGNMGLNPAFIDADGLDNVYGTADDDVRLHTGSPCIDSGDPVYAAATGETDIYGHQRVLGGWIDMGADEYTMPGDINGDGHVDVTDLLYLVDAFGSSTGDANYDIRCDFGGDGMVDVSDLLDLVYNFGT